MAEALFSCFNFDILQGGRAGGWGCEGIDPNTIKFKRLFCLNLDMKCDFFGFVFGFDTFKSVKFQHCLIGSKGTHGFAHPEVKFTQYFCAYNTVSH